VSNWILSQTESWGFANAWIFGKRQGKRHCYWNTIPSISYLFALENVGFLSSSCSLLLSFLLTRVRPGAYFVPIFLPFILRFLSSSPWNVHCTCEFLHMPLCRYVRKWPMNIFECLIDGFQWGCVGLHCIKVMAPKVLIMSRTDTNILKG